MPRWLLDARRTLLLAVVPLSLAGCAGMYEATGTASQQDLAQLHSDVEVLKVSEQRMHTEIETAVDVENALQHARVLATADAIMVVTGSIYLVGEAMALLGIAV